MDRDQWNAEAYRVWLELRMRRNLDPVSRTALEQLSLVSASPWLVRMERPTSPVAETMAAWCLKGAPRPWRICPGLDWDWQSTESAVLLAYPEPLAEDPLAMGGLAVFWALADGEIEFAVRALGAALLPAVYYSGIWDRKLKPVMGQWLAHYREPAQALGLDDVLAWADEAAEDDAGREVEWPDWPFRASAYGEQLRRGLVPHESRGRSPKDVAAVLLGLASVPPDQRRTAAQLAYKAIMGTALSADWEAGALGED